MFGFLSLYDLTNDDKWLKALIGAADYTETWTYCWYFPVHCNNSASPFSKRPLSGQSPVTIGTGGGDMYMAGRMIRGEICRNRFSGITGQQQIGMKRFRLETDSWERCASEER